MLKPDDVTTIQRLLGQVADDTLEELKQRFESRDAGQEKLKMLSGRLGKLPGNKNYDPPWSLARGQFVERKLPSIANEVGALIESEYKQRRERAAADVKARRGVPTAEDIEELSDEQLRLMQTLLADGADPSVYRLSILQQITRTYASVASWSFWWRGWTESPAGREAEVLANASASWIRKSKNAGSVRDCGKDVNRIVIDQAESRPGRTRTCAILFVRQASWPLDDGTKCGQ